MKDLSEKMTIDWIAFSVSVSDQNFQRVLSLGDGHKVEQFDYGRYGYNSSYRMLDGAWVYWHTSKPEAKIHVVLNSTSLALMDWRPLQLINRIRDWGAKFKRIDIALDDTGALLDIEVMYDKLRSGEVQTRFRKVKRVESCNLDEADKLGRTINIGQRSSQSFVRVYDKRAEQLAKDVDADDLPEHWVRVELELKGKKCEAFSDLLGGTAMGGQMTAGEMVGNLLYGLLDFKEPNSSESNKSRWETSLWWLEFLRATKKLKISLPKPIRSVERSMKWVYNQVKTTLAMIVLSEIDVNDQSGMDFIARCIKDGEGKMTETQQDILALYNAKQKEMKLGG